MKCTILLRVKNKGSGSQYVAGHGSRSRNSFINKNQVISNNLDIAGALLRITRGTFLGQCDQFRLRDRVSFVRDVPNPSTDWNDLFIMLFVIYTYLHTKKPLQRAIIVQST